MYHEEVAAPQRQVTRVIVDDDDEEYVVTTKGQRKVMPSVNESMVSEQRRFGGNKGGR